MISHIEVRNFQSLHHVELELHPLTVIVGPSSSGKSAFTRALRTLTSNKRGNEFISHGEKICTITAKTERGSVTLKRGKATNDNEYVVIPDDDPAAQRTYTKLGGETPQEVSDFLGIQSKDPINYAGQFDKPYLLDPRDASGGEVARVLGALTNVNVIFEAARESNRRKSSNAATLKTRAADLAAITEKSQSYRALKGQLAAIEIAEKNLDRARSLERIIARLTDAIEQERIATAAIERLRPYLELTVPDEQPIVRAAARLVAFRDALKESQASAQALTRAQAALDTAYAEEADIQQAFAQLLGQLTGGILSYYEEHSTTMQPALNNAAAPSTVLIYTTEAAQLAARYIAEVMK